MINGLLTLRGAWHRVTTDPVLKFFVVAISFYGMSTFEGPLLSVKSVNALSHYTDWTIAHVHGGALGWVGFMCFGMVYWLAPRLFQAPLARPGWATLHFWTATVGILLYVIAIYWTGLTQGLMWRALDADGLLQYPDFLESVTPLIPFYWLRVVGGSLYLFGAVLCGINLILTWRARPATYAVPVYEAAPLSRAFREETIPGSSLTEGSVVKLAHRLDVFAQMRWHRKWEGLTFLFTVLVVVAVVTASLFEIVPIFLRKGDTVRIANVTPYTPLELAGRDMYIAEGCMNCHSQMIRPLIAEVERYGEYSKPGESVYDHPFLWGSRRIGPDLARVGRKLPSPHWHVRHFNDPTDTSPGTIMPRYSHLLAKSLDLSTLASSMRAMQRVGVEYTDAEIEGALATAQAQAKLIGAKVVEEGGPEGVHDRQVVALIAYLLRLGTDIDKPAPTAAAPTSVSLGSAPQ
jgi:cytochrome c oxidase cbb3-type subunit I/II